MEECLPGTPVRTPAVLAVRPVHPALAPEPPPGLPGPDGRLGGDDARWLQAQQPAHGVQHPLVQVADRHVANVFGLTALAAEEAASTGPL